MSFESWYPVVAAVAGVAVLLVRRWVVRGPHGLDGTDLDGPQVGYLVGGPSRAVAAVLGGLRVDGAIAFTDGAVVRTGPPPRTWGSLGEAVHAVTTGKPGLTGLLRHLGPVYDELFSMRDELERRGWLLSGSARSRVTMAALPMWALGFVGAVMVVRAAATGRPFGWQIVVTGVVFYAAVRLSRVPVLTSRGRLALRRFTGANAHLGPDAAPSLRTYGAATAAVAVGLFGTDVLVPLDPRLARGIDELPYAPTDPPPPPPDVPRIATRYNTTRRGRGPSGGGPSCGGGCGGGCGGP